MSACHFELTIICGKIIIYVNSQFSSTVQTQIHGEEICEKLIYPQLVMKFPAVYDAEQFITTSATAHHFSFPCTT